MARPRRLLLVAVAVAAIVAGCGGDDEAASSADGDGAAEPQIGLPMVVGPLSKPQFLRQANEICRESWADMVRKFARNRREREAEEGRARTFAYTSRNIFLPQMQFWFDDISYLGAPRQGYDKERLEATLEALQLAVFSGEEYRIPSAEFYSAVFSSFNRLARIYGLDACVVDPESFVRAPSPGAQRDLN